MHATARKKSILKHGKLFIEFFHEKKISTPRAAFHVKPIRTGGESPVGIGIVQNAYYASGKILGQVKIGFEKGAVIIEAIQGAKPHENRFIPSNLELMQTFRTATGKTWANFLVEEIENHAREMGFRRVKIIKPEANSFYQWHVITPKGEKIPQKPAVQRGMRALYYGVARKMKYREEGNYLVKEL